MRTEINGRKPFVLAHADLDSQNVFVDDEGNLTGVIDWDGVAAVPLCIGPQSLPKFLTEDYDPNHYDYDVEAGEPRAGRIADSPEELTSYRAMYAQFIESYLSDKDRTAMVKSPRQARVVRMARKKAADMTRRSLITNNLQLAAKAPSQMEELMEHLFEEIAQLTAAKWGATPSTAISRAPGDREEGVKEIGDTKAGVVRNTGGAEEKPCVDSPEFEGTAVNVEGLSIDELMDKVGELTSASEVKKTSGSKETSCIGSPASDVATVNIEDLSLDELMDKIEELTGRLSANDSESDTKQDLADFQDDPSAEEKIPEPKHEAHVLNAESDKKIARMPRAARVCGW